MNIMFLQITAVKDHLW